MTKILAVFNSVSETTIPVENFILLDKNNFEKKCIVLNNSKEEVKKCLQKKGDFEHIEIFSLNFLKNKSINVSYYKKILFIVNKFKPDIIHVHHTLSSISVLLMKFLFANKKTKIILTMHNDFSYYKFLQKIIFRISLKLADHTIANSNNTLSKVKSFVKANQYSVIYNGVNQDQIINVNRNINEKISIGTVSRLIPQKDHSTLLKAMRLVVDELGASAPCLYIVGDGFLRKKIKNQIKELKIEDNVILTGQLDRKDVYKKLQFFDIFVVSSIFEGFCNAMVEAMMSRCAVIASSVDPLPEVIGGNDNGVIFKVGNYKKLATEILDLCKNDKRRVYYGNNARKYSINNYSMTRCVNEHTLLYRKLIK